MERERIVRLTIQMLARICKWDWDCCERESKRESIDNSYANLITIISRTSTRRKRDNY